MHSFHSTHSLTDQAHYWSATTAAGCTARELFEEKAARKKCARTFCKAERICLHVGYTSRTDVAVANDPSQTNFATATLKGSGTLSTQTVNATRCLNIQKLERSAAVLCGYPSHYGSPDAR